MDKKDLNLLIEKLPKYPGIHGKERLFNSAVMITLIMVDGEYNFLFEKRAKQIRQGGEICFPGGGYDSDSDTTCLDAAVRETVEELGISQKDIRVCGRMNTIVAAMGATIDPFIGILENISPDDIEIQKNEVEKIFCIPVSWFLTNKPEIYHIVLQMKPYETDENGNRKILLPVEELGLPKKYSKPWGNIKQRVLVYRTKEDVIWGLTAEMVHEFIKFYRGI